MSDIEQRSEAAWKLVFHLESLDGLNLERLFKIIEGDPELVRRMQADLDKHLWADLHGLPLHKSWTEGHYEGTGRNRRLVEEEHYEEIPENAARVAKYRELLRQAYLIMFDESAGLWP